MARGADPRGRLLTYVAVNLFDCLKSRGLVPPDADYRAFKADLAGGEEQPKPHAREVIERVGDDGGVTVLAHAAYALGGPVPPDPGAAQRLGALLGTLRGWGLWGVELYAYAGYDTETINRVVREHAASQGLRCTWGSDCHGPGSPHR